MKKILIIEDDPYVQRFYKKLFALQKFAIAIAADGQEGIEKAQNFLPDLILLDIMMPKMNGLEVLKLLKKNPVTYDIQVVMLTNFGEEQYLHEAIQNGASAFLLKAAYSPEQLIVQVEKFIGEKDRSPK